MKIAIGLFLTLWVIVQAEDSPSPIHRLFLGEWHTDTTQGRMYFYLSQHNDEEIECKILIYHGQWQSDPATFLRLFNVTNNEDDVYQYQVTSEATVSVGTQKKQCEVTADFAVQGTPGKFRVEGHIASDACHFEYRVDAEEYTDQMQRAPLLTYTFFYSCMAAALLYGYIRHMKDCLYSEHIAQQSSLMTWFMLAGMDTFLAAWHFNQSLRNPVNFDYLLMASVWSFSCMILLKERVLERLWRSQNPESHFFSRSAQQFRNKVFFWLFALVFLAAVLDFMYLVTVWLFHSFMIPQILKNAREGQKTSIRSRTLLFIVVPRILMILYFFGCPQNFLVWEPQTNYAWCLTLYIALQALILHRQRLRPRFFVPKRFRPVTYSYFRTASEERSIDDKNCAICMTPLNLQGQTSDDIVNTEPTMHTPCGHLYHQDCLANWFEIKHECPTCRANLPPIDTEFD